MSLKERLNKPIPIRKSKRRQSIQYSKSRHRQDLSALTKTTGRLWVVMTMTLLELGVVWCMYSSQN